MSASFPLAPPRSRSALAVGLLLLALVLAGLLGYQAQDAARSHRQVAERALAEHATFAVWEYSGILRRDIYVKSVVPGLDLVGTLGGKEPDRPLGPAAAADSLARAWSWPHEGRMDYLFRFDFRDGSVDWVGPASPSPGELRWIRDSLAVHAARVYDPDWEHASLLIDTSEGRRFLAYRLYPVSEAAPRVAYGFRSSLGTHRYLFEKIVTAVPLLPPSLTNGHATRELLSVEVRAPDGERLFASEPQYDSPFQATDTLGATFGGLTTRVAVRPEAAASLIIGGLPGSRLPLVLGLLVLTAGLVVAAILQLRREYQLAVLRADFVSGVSHELRTPLAQIRMFAETLLLGRVRSEEERRRSLEIVVKEARRLTHQVDNLLLFSRSERGRMSLAPEPADLSELVREAAESFAPLAGAAGLRLELRVEDGIRGRVDPVVFPQALLNLLDNAVKYGRSGNLVWLVLEARDGRARVRVEDEGPGVPSEDRERIWEPYHRLDRDRDSAVAGSGIGLSVVREVVTGLGGRAWVEDAPGGGAAFVLEVPGVPRDGARTTNAPDGEAGADGRPDSPPPSGARSEALPSGRET